MNKKKKKELREINLPLKSSFCLSEFPYNPVLWVLRRLLEMSEGSFEFIGDLEGKCPVASNYIRTFL